MLGFTINNETIQGGIPVSLLTKNLTYTGGQIVDKSNLTHPKLKKQAWNKSLVKKGDHFERFVVLKEVAPHIRSDGKGIRRKIKCLCKCGNIKDILLEKLKSGNTKSCGCLNKEMVSERSKKHGLLKHPLYDVWAHLKGRCLTPTNHKFKSYGARGIKVCEEWLKDFKVFYDWAIVNNWKQGLIMDRKDVNGDYCPDNCRFVDAGLSARNTRLLRSNNTSGYRGVGKKGKKWIARMEYNRKSLRLGSFNSPIDAAHAYDAKARELGAGHPLNFPEREI